ncbi:MAG: translation initiation factor IF-2 N-terminal domain-containing protein, partial [Ilumatobacteraceae bacterium]
MHELAKQLGMTNAEMMSLCDVMGVGVKSHSSTLIEAQADRLRRRAERDGLTRPDQPEEPKPVKKSAKKAAAAPADAPADGAEAPAPVKKAAAKAAVEPKVAAESKPAVEPEVVEAKAFVTTPTEPPAPPVARAATTPT